eukprot:jgi/Psemu1/29285/gm1.29285_g
MTYADRPAIVRYSVIPLKFDFDPESLEKIEFKHTTKDNGVLETANVKAPLITVGASLLQVLYTINEFLHANKTLSLTQGPKLYDKFSDLLQDYADQSWWDKFVTAQKNQMVTNFANTTNAFINYKFNNNGDAFRGHKRFLNNIKKTTNMTVHQFVSMVTFRTHSSYEEHYSPYEDSLRQITTFDKYGFKSLNHSYFVYPSNPIHLCRPRKQELLVLAVTLIPFWSPSFKYSRRYSSSLYRENNNNSSSNSNNNNNNNKGAQHNSNSSSNSSSTNTNASTNSKATPVTDPTPAAASQPKIRPMCLDLWLQKIHAIHSVTSPFPSIGANLAYILQHISNLHDEQAPIACALKQHELTQWSEFCELLPEDISSFSVLDCDPSLTSFLSLTPMKTPCILTLPPSPWMPLKLFKLHYLLNVKPITDFPMTSITFPTPATSNSTKLPEQLCFESWTYKNHDKSSFSELKNDSHFALLFVGFLAELKVQDFNTLNLFSDTKHLGSFLRTEYAKQLPRGKSCIQDTTYPMMVGKPSSAFELKALPAPTQGIGVIMTGVRATNTALEGIIDVSMTSKLQALRCSNIGEWCIHGVHVKLQAPRCSNLGERVIHHVPFWPKNLNIHHSELLSIKKK